MKKVLTIAGSDSSGGAGIQADLKTIAAHGLYGMSVITALTAQNTTGVYGILEADAAFVEAQMDAVFTDIFPDAVKIGMVSNADIIRAIANGLRRYQPKNIVVDPVMVSTSGSALLSPDAVQALCTELLPLATVITPNIPEAQKLSGEPIVDAAGMELAGEKIARHNPNTHGTGCTLSSAIACGLAKGQTLKESVTSAKDYVTRALKAGLDLGKGSGPLCHNV